MARAPSVLPPLREGVGPSCVGLPPGPWATMLDFLAERFAAQGRALWLQRLQSGLVVDEFGLPVAADRPYAPHMRLYYYRSLPPEPEIPFQEDLLFRDDHLVVVDKPHFLPVTPSGIYLQQTLLVRLKRRLGIETLVPLHRIDRETAGLVMFSVTPASRARYEALFRERRITKLYEAVAPWREDLPLPLTRSSRMGPAAHFMQQEEVPGVPNAITHIRMVQQRGTRASYELRPVTGQRHQLRVHMAALGVPIIGDSLYPVLAPWGPPDFTQPLQLLARALSFDDPLTGMPRSFVSRRALAQAPPENGAFG